MISKRIFQACSSQSTEPVRSRLTSLEAGMTLLRLSVAIYPPGSWVKAVKSTEEGAVESWILRSGISNWAWRAIEELKDDCEKRSILRLHSELTFAFSAAVLGTRCLTISHPNSSRVCPSVFITIYWIFVFRAFQHSFSSRENRL